MAANTALVEDLENSLQACLALLTNPSANHVHDSEEMKTSVEQTIQRFLDSAKQMECFFLQKRLLLSCQKPEQVILEDINELKNEIMRKDQVIQRYQEKLQSWQTILCDTNGPPSGAPAPGAPPPLGLQRPSASMVHVTGGGPVAPPTAPQLRHISPGSSQHMMSGPQGSSQSQAGPGMSMMQMQGAPGGQNMMPPPLSGGGGPGQGAIMSQMGSQGPPQMQQFMGNQTQPQASSLQGPLAYLERTTSNIGLPEPRR